ncbi:hypothetical protein DRN58_03735 [Thermococci archaeon]|nr:MAG: hypothetical protein DRN58_03735 [Thermococci archaeon]
MWRAIPKGERGTSPSRPSPPRSWCSVVQGIEEMRIVEYRFIWIGKGKIIDLYSLMFMPISFLKSINM